MKNPIKLIKRAYSNYKAVRNIPLRLEFIVTDYCNLNCKGCTHYSPLAEKEFSSLEVMERQMKHLSPICGDELKDIYLIGGETLLYPYLVEAMELAYRYFPRQKRYIFTNGIILPKMSEEFWEALVKYDFTLAITRYPISFDYDGVLEMCRDKGVKTEVFGDRTMADSFFRFGLDPEKKQHGVISHFKCYNRGCLSVVGDRLYPCSISACVGHLNKAKGTDFRHEKGDYLEIAQIDDVKQILALRDRPVPFCSYCKVPPATVSYGPSRRDVSEWVDC